MSRIIHQIQQRLLKLRRRRFLQWKRKVFGMGSTQSTATIPFLYEESLQNPFKTLKMSLQHIVQEVLASSSLKQLFYAVHDAIFMINKDAAGPWQWSSSALDEHWFYRLIFCHHVLYV